MSTLRVLGPVLLASLFAAAVVGCGPSLSKGQGSGNGTAPGSSQNGVTGNAVCASAEHTVTTTSRSGSSIALDGNYVYVREYGSNGAGLTRTPILGGDADMIDPAEVDVFAVGGSGTVAWSRYSNMMAPTVNRLDAKHGMTSLVLPDAATNVTSLAIDGNDNVFVLANDKTGGNTVWRYSASHDQFDLIHHNLGGLQGFMRDGDSIAWIGPSSSGSPAIYREDVLGGAPTVLMALDTQNGGQQVLGIDAQNVYVSSNGYVLTAIDRSSLVARTALDLTPQPNNENQIYAQLGSLAIDDTYFYWIASDNGTGQSMLMRSTKAADQPQVLATVDGIQSIAVVGCNVAYTGSVDTSSASDLSVIVRPR